MVSLHRTKATARRFLLALAPIRLLAYARSMCVREITVLAYHRVLDLLSEDEFKFDPELVSASTEQFKWQMKYIKKRFSPVTFAQVIEAVEGSGVLPRRPILITFDDGFADNYYNAFPILRSLGIPATFFLTTGYIGGQKTFWFDRVVRMIRSESEGDFHVPGTDLVVNLKRGMDSRRKAALEVLRYLKMTSDEMRRKIVAAMEREREEKYPVLDHEDSRPLTWDQVKEMVAAGMELGSHTVTHPVLSNVEQGILERELDESRAEIARQTGVFVDVLAYPIGRESAFDVRVQEAAKKAGYKLACSYIPGCNRWNSLEQFALRRLAVERYLSRDLFTFMVGFPEVYARYD